MKISTLPRLLLPVAATLALCANARATQTENNGIAVLPAPGAVSIDGQTGDWDLSGGIFVSDSVETQRDTIAVWMHAMYDAQNLYLLARFKDTTPLNNPGQTIADYGFAGDSLQVRFGFDLGTPDARISHWTNWRGNNGRDVMDVVYGQKFDEGALKDAQTQGAKQSFKANADGKGYVQEMAIPWKLLTKDGKAPAVGASFSLTFEPNFTVGATETRMSVKGNFKPGLVPDRVFTFQGPNSWGPATMEAVGHIAPHPVRLSDSRLFPVAMENGVPVVNWDGLNSEAGPMPGVVTIPFMMPADGFISLNIRDKNGVVVRQLLNDAPYSKGAHEVKWDGLTTPNWKEPGEPVAPGNYGWSALYHGPIGLKLRGWADNGGSAPWDNGPNTNWGGDHGIPVAAASDERHVFLGWSGAEAGNALVATDLDGNVQWSNKRGGIAGVKGLAADAGVLYILGGLSGIASEGGSIYKLDAATGKYVAWTGREDADLAIKSLWPDATNAVEKADAIAAANGKIYLSFKDANKITVVDGASGKLVKLLDAATPTSMQAAGDKLTVLSGGTMVTVFDVKSDTKRDLITGLQNAKALALDNAGRIYIGLGEPSNQVRVYGGNGKRRQTIGREGGRALLGKWTPDGMRFINSLTVDSRDKLWVAEADYFPKRISAWNGRGTLWKEFFGPTSYGAIGGAINPTDPNLMAGQGCEWRIDPATGRASCLGVITREGMENARFGVGNGGRVYLAVAPTWTYQSGPLNIFERVGAGQWKLRSRIYHADSNGGEVALPAPGQKTGAARTVLWADKNGDEKSQPDELVSSTTGEARFSGWYLPATQDLTLYSGDHQFKVQGFTQAGAPIYDLANPVVMPVAGTGSADGKLVLKGGEYAANNSWFSAYDIASGQMLWRYPDNFVGVHGSHNATPPQRGMIRGSFGPTGSVKLAAPIGNIWVIPTNVGEWHVLTEDGFYLTQLFQGDPLQVKWPDRAVPGASLTEVPPGLGGEDFGGSIAKGPDGKLYLQAGKTGFWNMEVTGLESARKLKGTTLALDAGQIVQAGRLREAQLQTAVGKVSLTVAKLTPKFTGNLDADFKGAQTVTFQKSPEAAVRSALAYDAKNLYLAWDVKDNTPWQNGATEAAQMYLSGDTVDFQLGADSKADPNRGESAMGDLRLSIGDLGGVNTAVIYRKISDQKKPKIFSSGVIKTYPMDFVDVVKDAEIKVTKRGDGTVVEAAIPLSELGIQAAPGLSLRGDVGVTHGDAAGERTRLRTYWSNQHTGIVDDAVFELMLEPKHWGEVKFGP